ncbi:unnamed protein product (macronuclear) [Paramecium tetraurelia]|uniref:guanylate kinase n=1 Tax=Paramecium tetraurelia TaxID=5888 RepID=Q6BFB0_PARTE|nr:Guanylate kinase [Paramecium tetraurelia strain d4-2]XP_001422967.1 uncharacterized protein GSPATT00000004001 [Paramecium tetraurelia]CAH03661.1 Guanylate kinase, putative [Paramecium tetraurelia]CAK55569.1 unnamed protein product [Paramecium tetraurelia]|eukprot:XP_001422967.1 hypothetical protein (macronuclear) [Paramecium tetraurelia strain d4-2]
MTCDIISFIYYQYKINQRNQYIGLKNSRNACQNYSNINYKILMKAIYKFSTIKPLIVSGPSGVGKGSLVTRLLQNSQSFVYSVSLTTRKPRPNEQNGVNYHFVNKDVFEENIKNNEFLEVCEVHGNLYGTAKNQINDIIKQNKIPLIEIDVQGAEKINRQLNNQCVNIFILPPSISILRERLIGRKTETSDVVEKRIKNAETEIEKAKSFQFYHFIVNDNFETCYKELLEFVNKKYQNL